MAIRIRTVAGCVVALCAAETDEQPGDVYLDDAAHHALTTKFGLDWQSEGLLIDPPIDNQIAELMETQKLRDAKEELVKWISIGN